MRNLITIVTLISAAGLLAACTTERVSPPKLQPVNTQSLPAAASAAATAETPLSRAILKSVNEFRAGKGVPVLASDAKLQRAAAVHAADMAQRDYFGHFSPEGQGPRERILAVDPAFAGRSAENILFVEGKSFMSMSDAQVAEVFVTKWSQSPPHRKNMQAAEMNRSGVGIAKTSNRIIAVQVFSGP